MKSVLKRLSRILASLAFLGAAAAFSVLLWATRPVAEKNPPSDSLPVVEVLPVRYEAIAFNLPTQGIVEARRRSDLAAEVAGRVVEVNPAFEAGMRLAEGSWLIRLDPTDYRAAVAAAASTLADAEATLASEEARAEQARSDWRRLGHGGDPPDLTVRGPQVRSARARAASAAAALERAETDLGRCEVVAPFDCIVSAKRTELGSYLVPGAAVASVFATGPFEVRLPLPVDRLQFLELEDGVGKPGGVEIHLTAGGETVNLPARIVRAEGEIDRASRSAYLVAEIGGTAEGAVAVQPGLFVKATIRGRTMPSLAKVPFPAFVDLERVAVVAPDDTLEFRDVTVVFREGESVYVSGGVAEGERLCLTELPSMIRGLKVSPAPAATETAPDTPPIPSAP
jgi:multidrug efflux system membrane fusion protein